jgi:hypothetical protein
MEHWMLPIGEAAFLSSSSFLSLAAVAAEYSPIIF